MVLLAHSAFIGLEGFYIIESAVILYDHHNVPLKNASSMMTATRNYTQCLSTSCVICRQLSDRTNGEISKFTKYSIIWCMFYTKCHTIGEGRLKMIKRSFQHKLNAFFVAGQFVVVQRCPQPHSLPNLNLHPTTSLFPKSLEAPQEGLNRGEGGWGSLRLLTVKNKSF